MTLQYALRAWERREDGESRLVLVDLTIQEATRLLRRMDHAAEMAKLDDRLYRLSFWHYPVMVNVWAESPFQERLEAIEEAVDEAGGDTVLLTAPLDLEALGRSEAAERLDYAVLELNHRDMLWELGLKHAGRYESGYLLRQDVEAVLRPWLVKSIQPHEPDGKPVPRYWSNEQGWVTLRDAALFSEEERATLNLPIGGACTRWEEVR